MATCKTTSTYLSLYTLYPISPNKNIHRQSEMDQGYKHFSHSHNLMMHQLPEGVEVSCSGCNSSGTEIVYVCWQCNFFLHEQCYRATRSLKHPSHPSHPLTLVPYPTYPSNSFYCNSCEIIGTGFAYSCADCEFDLHVQCAYSISGATSFQKSHLYQELVPPSWNISLENSNMTHNIPFVSVPDSLSIPLTSAHDHYLPPNSVSNAQYYPASHDLAYDSIPPGRQNSIPTVQGRPMAQNGTSVSIPMASTLYPSIVQDGSFVSIPTNPLNHFHSAQNPSMHQNRPYNSIPTDQSGQSHLKDKGILHFSHPHNLSLVNLQEDDKTEVICSGCEKGLVGKGYSCEEPNCNFHLHESCFQLKKEIQHKSHPEHPLILLPSGPYKNKNGQFTCNACFDDGSGFTYHCSVCEFDLHIRCVSLPETVKRADHDHVLQLVYSCPVKGEEYTFSCDVCNRAIDQRDSWVYYCKSCDYGTHLGCVNCEEVKGESVLDVQVELQRLQLQMEMARQQAQLIASMGSSVASLA